MKRRTWATLARLAIMGVLIAAAWRLREADMPLAVQGTLMIACAIAIGDLGLRVSRRIVPFGMLRRHGSAQTAVFAIVGTVYGLIAAFVIVMVWEKYHEAELVVSHEANALGDLERISRGFDVVVRRQAQEAARTYAFQVINNEWRLMGQGQTSPRAHAALVELWQVYTDLKGGAATEAVMDHSIDRLTQIDDNRRLRVTLSRDRVPAVMWLMLYAGGYATIALAYFFESPNDWFHRVVVGMLSFTIMLAIFLVAALEGPLGGELGVAPGAFQFVLDNMQNLEK